MAAVASRAFASGLTDGIGTLVEHKLDKFAERGGERFRPWVGVARALVIDTGTRARRPLVYALFADSRYLRRPELSALADLFLQGKPNEPELALLIKVLLGEVWSYETESLAQFGKLRAGQAKLVDRVAFRYGRDNDRLLKYWQSLAPSDHTPISEAVTRLVQDGVALKDITLEQIEQEPRPATVGDCGQNPEVTEQVGLKPVPARTSLATGAGQIFVRLAKAMGHVLNRDRTRHANDRD